MNLDIFNEIEIQLHIILSVLHFNELKFVNDLLHSRPKLNSMNCNKVVMTSDITNVYGQLELNE